MTKRALSLTAVLLTLALGMMGRPCEDGSLLEKARAAFGARDYQAAIRYCDAGLAGAAADYELGFLRARALAFSGDHDRAALETSRLLALFPDNTDVLLLKARIDGWRGRTGDAEAEYERVLRRNPRDAEALCGLAGLALNRGDVVRAGEFEARAFEAAPDDASVLYWKGRVEEARGDLAAARVSYSAALAREPGDTDIQAALARLAVPRPAGMEVRYRFGMDDYSNGPSAFPRHELAFEFEAPKGIGTAVLKMSQTQRLGQGDARFGMELYPRLWRGAYGWIDLGWSPRAVSYARSSWRVEVYQKVLRAAEISGGWWAMNFPDRRVSIALGSAALYLGPYYGVFRVYYDTLAPSRSVSWIGRLRGYFSGPSYITVGYGRGERLTDERTAEDLLIERSRTFTAGATVYVLRHVRLEINVTRVRDRNGFRLDSIEAATGYRW